jgi:small subunit ribosomal protein S3
MGHKVHPIGFRLGVIRDWQAKWYADKHYAEFLQEDLKLRKAIQSKYAEAAVSTVEIERQSNQVSITIHTARPGIVIGRGGQRVDETRRYLEQLIGKRVQLNIQEIQQPELDAYLVSKSIAEQIERRIAYRRAMKQVMLRTMQAGAKGMRVSCSGRLGGAEIARRLTMHEGQVPLHTLRADIDYGFVEARTTMGRIGVKVWIFKGEILPEPKEEEYEEVSPEPVMEDSSDEIIDMVSAEEAPIEIVSEESAEEVQPESSDNVTPVAEAEDKPARTTTRRKTKAATSAEPEAETAEEITPPTEEEKKPAKPRAKRTKAKPEESAETDEEATTETKVEAVNDTEPAIEKEEDNATT